ncbi:photosystem I reaction center subunit PsaK [Pseudanabaena galeata UHCC 0370]|jgi:photosystem I subunit X|uniref:Photosystem I reaction center subunit PsaK n=1 Tax=Pseudanabaena galeata UHCC 0370 TaxID=3110310 RepID=A0ABU5TGL6_9CYAN|nr:MULTISPECIES: photosystem I reaction center subunit PsaK [Pseudanabaena]MEA5477183.1 photosystem I reaction center subunit PsaK [Pseudanabaena galeata UHCC 0370]MEA5488143.1 photosystem I reaction center subunit PsaK [Pseudanabaena sp. CCNP1317]WGS72756.1 photosystem I reaction center subunit PsaK [Pseudanabaena galeata CCNP1313]
MTNLAFNLLAAVPTTPTWSASVGLVMITANVFALVVARYGIQVKGVGPSLPVQLPGLFSGFGLPEFLAVTSFGHVLGAGLILGLAQAGLL